MGNGCSNKEADLSCLKRHPKKLSFSPMEELKKHQEVPHIEDEVLKEDIDAFQKFYDDVEEEFLNYMKIGKI